MAKNDNTISKNCANESNLIMYLKCNVNMRTLNC